MISNGCSIGSQSFEFVRKLNGEPGVSGPCCFHQNRFQRADCNMTSFSPFIRKTSPEMREVLSQVLQLPMADDVNWADAGQKFAQEMVKEADQQGRSSILKRIAAMSYDNGYVARESA